jgi:L-lactate dehydrogenase complex protein LldG
VPAEPAEALVASACAAGMGARRVGSAREAVEAALAAARGAGGKIGVADLGPELDGLLPPAADKAQVALVPAGDGRISPQEAEPLCAGITRADLALADVGALVQAARPGGGRLASLLPPLHICLVHAGDVLPSLADLPAALRDPARFPGGPPPALNLIGGPSKTGDIEAVIVLGVHGPGQVEVVVWG